MCREELLRLWLSPQALIVALSMGCEAAPPAREVSGDELLGYVDAQLAFGPRVPGSGGHQAVGNWLDSLLRTRADTVLIDPWTHITRRGDSLPLRNILARFNSASQDRILYVAHWDTRPRADGEYSTDSMAPVPGANDGASGVAVLLGVANALRAERPKIGVDLLFVDGEDYGSFQDTSETLLGSQRFARQMSPDQRPAFAVVWDMVGDQDQRFVQEGYSLSAAPDVVSWVWAVAKKLGYEARFPAEAGRELIDDHVPLQRAGIRAINVIDLEYGPKNRFHHTPEDTRERLSGESLAVAAHLALALVRVGVPAAGS